MRGGGLHNATGGCNARRGSRRDNKETYMPRPLAPERSHAQRLAALEEANRIRSKRARLKVSLRDGLSPLEVIDDPDCETMKTADLLLALPRIGRVKSNRIMRRAGVSPSKTLGGMSERQRRDLLGMLA